MGHNCVQWCADIWTVLTNYCWFILGLGLSLPRLLLAGGTVFGRDTCGFVCLWVCPTKWSAVLQAKRKMFHSAPPLFPIERSKVRVKKSKIAKMPRLFFGCNSAANNVFTSAQCSNSGGGYACCLPRTADFLLFFLPRNAMHKRGLCRHAVFVRPSVCPSVCHVRGSCQNE